MAADSAQESTIQRSGVRELPGGKTKRLGPWTGEEDALLLQLVTAFGLQATEAAKPATGFAAAAVPAGANPNDHGWGAVAVKMGMRTSKQCRERWRNYVDPALRKGAWAKDEQALFVEAHKALGNACKRHDHCWHLGCILPRVPAIIVRTGAGGILAGGACRVVGALAAGALAGRDARGAGAVPVGGERAVGARVGVKGQRFCTLYTNRSPQRTVALGIPALRQSSRRVMLRPRRRR